MIDTSTLNTKHIGDISVAACIYYYLSKGYQVLQPFGDRGHYDLVIEKDGCFQRVQSKWTSLKKVNQDYYRVFMQVTAGRRDAAGKRIIHRYVEKDFDLLWVGTPRGFYSIPSKDIFESCLSMHSLVLFPHFDRYLCVMPDPVAGGSETNRRVSPRLTQDDKMMIKRLVKEGRTQADISALLGVTESCISMFMSRNRSFVETSDAQP